MASDQESNTHQQSKLMTDKVNSRDLLKLVDADIIDGQQHQQLLERSGILPQQANWHAFLTGFLASLGTVFLIAGIIFFFAYNWADLTKVHKFTALQIAIVLGTAYIWKKGLDVLAGKLAVVAVVMLIGVLMAVFGQIYQTGADAYELFLNWAIIIFPIAILSRFTALWFIWLIILNTALSLYSHQEVGREVSFVYYARLGLGLYAAFLIAWELLAAYKFKWMRQPFFIGLVFSFCLVYASGLAIYYVLSTVEGRYFNFGQPDFLNVFLYMVTITVSFIYYQAMRHNLFIAALTYLSLGILSIVTIVVHTKFGSDLLLLTGVVIVVEALLAVAILRRQQMAWRASS